MDRRIYEELLSWKNDDMRKPLLLEGVRQCGKTYILKKFGKENYDSVAYFNFESNPNLASFFLGELNPHRLIKDLSLFINKPINEGTTLIILDEVQSVPRVLTSLKYFCEDAPGYHLACAGSLLGLLTSKPDSFPVGKVDRMRMFPMDFEEFLIANNEHGLAEFIRTRKVDERIPLLFHERLVGYLKYYYFVGGMPEAVSSWVQYANPEKVTTILKRILDGYRDDFSKHVEDISKITAIWDSIPSQLSKENSRFIFSHAIPGARSADLEDQVKWVENAGMVYRVCKIDTPKIPLKTSSNRSQYKLYLVDVGLFRVMSSRRANDVLMDSEVDKEYRGAQAENFVLCQLKSNGAEEVCYWREGTYEVDFLVEGSGGPVPIEVKSGENVDSRSLKKFVETYGTEDNHLVSIRQDAGGKNGRMPLYCTGMIPSYISKGTIISSDEHKVHVPWTTLFRVDDWIECEGSFVLEFPRGRHGISKPVSVRVLKMVGDSYVPASSDVVISDRGVVIMKNDEPFDGFVSVE